jgi:hypothetical protein
LTLSVSTLEPVGPLPGVAVTLDGAYQGTTPLNGTLFLGEVSGGPHSLLLQAKHYLVYRASFNVTAPLAVDAQMNATGGSGVFTGSYFPAQATFQVDPYPPVTPDGTTPGGSTFTLLLPPGSYNFTLSYHGAVTSGAVSIVSGRTIWVHLTVSNTTSPAPAPADPFSSPWVLGGLAAVGVAVGLGVALVVVVVRRRRTPRAPAPPPRQA